MKFYARISSKPLPDSSESSRELVFWGVDSLQGHLRRIDTLLTSTLLNKKHLKVEFEREDD